MGWEFLGGSVVRTVLSLPSSQVQSVVRNLRSRNPRKKILMESDFIKHWGRALLPTNLCPSQVSYINKSTSCRSLCFLLNSFCAETQRTWALVSPGSRDWNPHQVGDTKPAAHQHVEPRAVGARRFMMLTATYLTISQSKKSSWADHTHFEPLLYNSSLPPLVWDTQFWRH